MVLLRVVIILGIYDGKEYYGSRVEIKKPISSDTDVAPQATGKIEPETVRYLSAASAISDRRYDRYYLTSCAGSLSDVLISVEFPPSNLI